MICEGTTLNRPDYSHISEQELQSQIKTVLEENKYVFVLCSSTNFDRIASVCSVIPKGKYCICDDYQCEMIQFALIIITNTVSSADRRHEKCGVCL